MTMDIKTAAYYASVAQHPIDGAGSGRLLTGMAIAYAIIVVGLAAKLAYSNAPNWSVQEPTEPHAPSIASDLAAIPTDLPIGITDGTGYADAMVKQAYESREPGGSRVAARDARKAGTP